MGWITTLGAHETMTTQISMMPEGGSGTDVPDLSIEADDLEAALTRSEKANIPIEHRRSSSVARVHHVIPTDRDESVERGRR